MTITTEKRGLMHYAEYWKSEKSENQKNVREERTMNNREYANRLTDTEFVKWGRKFFGTDWDSASVVMSDKEIFEESIKILSQPHETTCHEDLVNAGWELRSDDSMGSE